MPEKRKGTMDIREILRQLYLYESISGTWLANRTEKCNQVISHPWDHELVREVAREFGLRYIYIGEGNPQATMYARGKRVTPLLGPILVSQEQRLAMYLLNPYLEVVYRAGNAVILRVNLD